LARWKSPQLIRPTPPALRSSPIPNPLPTSTSNSARPLSPRSPFSPRLSNLKSGLPASPSAPPSRHRRLPLHRCVPMYCCLPLHRPLPFKLGTFLFSSPAVRHHPTQSSLLTRVPLCPHATQIPHHPRTPGAKKF